jgi:soluble lytic murein transglycosylase-like protein
VRIALLLIFLYLSPLDTEIDRMINTLSTIYNVPARVVEAIMLAESEGNPNAIGDRGKSIGLFQLHEQGLGYGMSKEERLDPAWNAKIAIPVIAEQYREGLERGFSGEPLIRYTYEAINPGGGWGIQGNKVIQWYRFMSN